MKLIKAHWYLLVAVAVAVALQLYSTQCAPGITYDSNQYLASAKSFAKNYTLLHADDTPHIDHVPLYSLILSLLGEHRLQLSKYLNTVCLVSILWSFIYLCRQTLPSYVSKILFALSLGIATPLQLIHHFIWSEPLFVALIGWLMVLLYKYQRQPQARYYWAMIVVSFIMCLQRNPGIFLVAGITLSLWFFTKTGFWRTVLYGVLAVSGWVIWTLVGMQIAKEGLHPAAYNIFGNILVKQNLDHYLNAVSAWFIPVTVPLWVRGGGFIVGILVVFWWMKKRKLKLDNFTLMLLVVAIVYIVFLQLTERISFHETERYAAVVFPLLWGVFFQVYYTISQSFSSTKQWLMNILLVLWLSYPLLRTAKNIHLWQKRACQPTYIRQQTNDPKMIFYNETNKDKK
ncbi:hypothetical protein [uncultured Microscilla sp.]|uniref:hypothetical protein n=1 Tax=uncultured Microscilla sp. TaxID=432653 RepID=UPI002628EFE7|nr:hypothetical protein [uncultured Microscilla sp.]